MSDVNQLTKDKLRLQEMRGQLEPLFPGIKEMHASVQSQLDTLRNQREEIELADQEELRRVREEISIVSEGLEMRRAEIQVQEHDAMELSSEEAALRKQIEECREKIERAERVKELNRGFEKNEVEEFKGMVVMDLAKLENLRVLGDVSGWKVTRVQGSTVEMVFEDEIAITFDVQEIGRGGSAIVKPLGVTDAIRQFTCSALTPDNLKGGLRQVH